jgi:hypothetical protein
MASCAFLCSRGRNRMKLEGLSCLPSLSAIVCSVRSIDFGFGMCSLDLCFYAEAHPRPGARQLQRRQRIIGDGVLDV